MQKCGPERGAHPSRGSPASLPCSRKTLASSSPGMLASQLSLLSSPPLLILVLRACRVQVSYGILDMGTTTVRYIPAYIPVHAVYHRTISTQLAHASELFNTEFQHHRIILGRAFSNIPTLELNIVTCSGFITGMLTHW